MQVTLDHDDSIQWVLLTRHVGEYGIRRLAEYFESQAKAQTSGYTQDVDPLITARQTADYWYSAYKKLAFAMADIVGRDKLSGNTDETISDLIRDIKAMIAKESTS